MWLTPSPLRNCTRAAGVLEPESLVSSSRYLPRASGGADSSGIALLLNAFRHLDHTGRQLAIACPMGSPRRAFELTALDRQLPMHETRQDALAAIGAN